MFKRLLLAPLLVMLTALPAVAKPVVIAELGTAPLLGTSRNTSEMRARVAANGAFVSQAAHKLGLTDKQYAEFSTAIASSHVAWVTVPRHLDAMSWRSGSSVYVLHDVIIPARTNGWEVDVTAAHERIAVYMPAACGNVSIVRTALPMVARTPVKKPVVAPPAVAVVDAPAPVVAEEPPAVIPDDSLAPRVVAATQTEFPPAAAAHHVTPLFLAPLLFGLAALSGGSGSGPIVAPPAGCP